LPTRTRNIGVSSAFSALCEKSPQLGSTLPGVGVEITLQGMSTLSEVEAVVPQFSVRELAELERFVRQTRLTKQKGSGRSALDLPPLDLGQMLRPLGTREEWYDEMLEDRA
jgi:hypothetical protein